MKPVYLLNLTLSVNDAAALWSAAATVAMASPGMTIEDVVETIGPKEDPSIEDCVAMLAQPGRYDGCAVTALDCARVDDVASTGRIGEPLESEPVATPTTAWSMGRLVRAISRATPAPAR